MYNINRVAIHQELLVEFSYNLHEIFFIKFILVILLVLELIVTCYIPNSKTCLRHIQLQYNIKSPQLFGFICAQNFISNLVLYNRFNFHSLFELKSTVIFIYLHHIIIFFKLCKITWTLHGVFSFPIRTPI